jgi:hypothetical protein
MIQMDLIQVRLAGITHSIQAHELERYLQIGWERIVGDEVKPETLTSQDKPKKTTRKVK